MSTINKYLAGIPGFAARNSRPWVTLSYAQSLDGSLTAQIGQGTAISGPQSKQLTHQLRAAHQAILVGVGTVLADDPHLGVRHAEGCDPLPVILDSHLRTPLEARLLRRASNLPVILCSPQADKQRRAALEGAGARVLEVQQNPAGLLDLQLALGKLYELNISSLMVEGGAQVIQSFLEARLFEALIVTIAPRWIGGLPAVNGNALSVPPLREFTWEQYGADVVLWALSGSPLHP